MLTMPTVTCAPTPRSRAPAPSGALIKGQQYLYDDAGRLRSVPVQEYVGGVQSFSTHDFDYDAAGHRMRRTTATGRVTDFVYGRTGMLLGEYTGGVLYGKEYVYLGSQLIASPKTNEPPRADAGPDRVVDGGTEVTLDGRGSADPDGSISIYAWRQTAGPAVALSSPASATTRFTAPRLPAEARLRFELTVTDRAGESAADKVEVLVRPPPNSLPKASAGPDQTVRGGTTVALDGRASSDVDGSIGAYAWQQTAGTPAGLSDAHSATPSFVAPTLAADEVLTFTLTVTDDRDASGTDTVAITVKGNRAPIADAGADQFVLGGATVILDGTGSSDIDGSIVGYAWRQTAGIPVSLQDPDTASPSFQAPGSAMEQALRFTLTVTDDLGAAGTATVTVMVSVHRPVADAGPDQVVIASARVRLDGTGSHDDAGPIVRYAWRQDTGTEVGLSGGDTATPSFMAPIRAATETLRFILTVTDDRGLSATDTVDVHVIGFAARDLPATTRVSVSSDGTEGNGMSRRATVSANGRYVAFDSSGSDLVIGDTNNTRDVFVHDRWTGDTTRISVASGRTQANKASEDPSISAGGRYVSFRSYATNLVQGDTNNLQDVFVHDRETGETTRVSVASDGREASGFAHALSGDGRYVAFDSASPNLVSEDTNNVSDVFVHDRRTRATTRVSVAIDGQEVYMNQPSLGPVISADGRYVAFASSGLKPPRLHPGDHFIWNVFVHDRETGKTSLVSAPFDESLHFNAPYMSGYSFNPALSADGRYVVFDSTSNYLVRGDETPSHEIFVRDRATATTTQIDGVAEISPNAVISGDGRYVAFAAYTNEAIGQISVHDRDTGETTLMSVANDGTQGNGDSNGPALSADGRYVVFESEATNLIEGDTNGTADVFVKDRFPPPANEPPQADAGGDAAASGGATVILDARASRDPDGSIIAYLWQQTAGTSVGLSDANGATASFTAPTLPTPEDLSFALTVVDNRGAGTTDTVVIHIEPSTSSGEPPSSPADTGAPSTHYQRKRTRVDGVPAYTVTLTPNEPASVHFRVKGVGRIVGGARPISDWQPYSHPFTVKLARPGPAQVMFYAVDAAGNIENSKRRILRRRR